MKPEVGVEIFNNSMKKEKVDFVMGPTPSAIGVAAADLARQQNEILIPTQAAASAAASTVNGNLIERGEKDLKACEEGLRMH